MIEIFELKRKWSGDFVIDPRRHVATVTVQDGQGEVKVFNKLNEKIIRKLFEGTAVEFVGGGGGADAIKTYPAWTPEAVQVALKKLDSFSLGSRIVTP